jgi:uncharacterized protein YecE (DUF72 family)
MIRVGIGGWTFAPWRGPFYPKGLPHKDELRHASRHVTAIEINGTFYRTQTPASYRKWAEETPDNFVFALKGHRFVTNRKVLAEAGDAVRHFIDSGILELGSKLGPINWQLAPTKRFDAADIDAFLGLLPREAEARRLRHAIEVRHESFITPDFVAIARRHNVAIVYAEADDYPGIPDVTADFIYGRLQRSRAGEALGYPAPELDTWAERAKAWHGSGAADGLPCLAEAAESRPREVFLFFISGEKVCNPAAAMALLERL